LVVSIIAVIIFLPRAVKTPELKQNLKPSCWKSTNPIR